MVQSSLSHAFESKPVEITRVSSDNWYLSDTFGFRTGIDKYETRNGAESMYLKSVVAIPKSWVFISK